MFSNLNKPAFGAAPSTNTFGFGNTSANANPFGPPQLFGKPVNTFGNTGSAFGSPATPLFGQTQPQGNTLFGSTSTPAFGTPTQNQSGYGTSIFGNTPQPSGSGLFGATNNSFGQQNKPAGFGFGGNTSGNLFGQQAQQPQQTAFQPSSSGNLFGSSSGFGTSIPTGTTIKFSPVTGTDTMQKGGIAHTISTKHYSITCMKEYESKSLEELRWEDYQANRKGPQQSSGFGTTPFGATTSTPSLFGQSENKSSFGQSGFGQSTPAFGMASQPNTSAGIFGKPSTTGFGTTTSAATFGFNTTTPSNPFGANTGPKLFGTPPTQNLFGTPNAQPTVPFGGNLFGQTSAQNTSGLFGKPTQPTVFNTTQSGFGFGQPPATQTSTLFQTPKPAANFNLFGQNNAGSGGFGQQNTFGQTNQNTFSGFNKPPLTTFGQPTQTNFGIGTQNNSSLFGNAPKPGGLFGTNTSGLFSNTFPTNTGFNMQPQQQPQPVVPSVIEIQQEFKTAMQLLGQFGHNSHLSGLSPMKEADMFRATNPIEIRALLDTPKKVETSPPTTDKIKITPLTNKKMNIFEGVMDKNASDSNVHLRTMCKRLLLRKKSSDAHGLYARSLMDTNFDENKENTGNNALSFNESGEMKDSLFYGTPSSVNLATEGRKPNKSEDVLKSSENLDVKQHDDSRIDTNSDSISMSSLKVNPIRIGSESGVSFLNPSFSEAADNDSAVDLIETRISDPCGIVLQRPEYYTIPALEELPKFKGEDGTCMVQGFTIGRVGYGNVHFPDTIDVSNLNIDECVHFRHKELTIYPDDAKKPPLGQGLNRPAQVTLDRVYPHCRESHKLITDPEELISMNFPEKLRQISIKHGFKFVDYRPEAGSWVFVVDHFSKYGFTDSDDEEIAEEMLKLKNQALQRDGEMRMEQDLQIQEELQRMMMKGLGGVSKELHTHSPQQVLEASEFDFIEMKNHSFAADPKMVNLMKYSFFDDDSVSDDLSSTEFMIMQPFDEKDLPFLTSLMSEDWKYFSLNTAPIRNLHGNIPTERSYLQPRNYSDIAMFKGRSFKVGWGRGMTLVTVPTRLSTYEYTPINVVNNSDFSSQAVSIMQVDDLSSDLFLNVVLDHLYVVKCSSEVKVDSDGIPTGEMNDGYACLSTHCSLSENFAKKHPRNKQAQYYKTIWALCRVFWAPDHKMFTKTRQLFSEWCEIHTAEQVEIDLKKNQKENFSTTFECLFIYLSGHQILNAAEYAMKERLPNISLLISQLSSNEQERQLLREQVSLWKNSDGVRNVPDDILRLYLIFAGIPLNDEVNICDHLDWKRALAMYLWYIAPTASPLLTSLKLYEEAFQIYGCAARPTPPHLGADCDSVYDILFHIMMLYSNMKLCVDDILIPSTHTDNPIDYSLSWLLLQTFSALKVDLISEGARNLININLATQLENLGHWKWAIFVMLFTKDSSFKKNTILSILDRNLSFTCNKECIKDENLLVNDFKLPAEWIHSVKVHKCRKVGSYCEMSKHLSYIGDWNKCHNIFIDKIVPNLVTNDRYDLLKKFVDMLMPGSGEILQWSNEAGVLDAFLQIYNAVNNQTLNTDSDIRTLQASFTSLFQKVKYFPVKSAIQGLCISELSKQCAILLDKFKRDNNIQDDQISAAELVEELVMPEDYFLFEAVQRVAKKQRTDEEVDVDN